MIGTLKIRAFCVYHPTIPQLLLNCWHIELSKDGEMYHIESVNVPFPDEDKYEYEVTFAQNLMDWKWMWKRFVLIELA